MAICPEYKQILIDAALTQARCYDQIAAEYRAKAASVDSGRTHLEQRRAMRACAVDNTRAAAQLRDAAKALEAVQ